MDGEFLAVGGKAGKLSIWALTEDIYESVYDVYQSLKLNPFFWKDYPINIEPKSETPF